MDADFEEYEISAIKALIVEIFILHNVTREIAERVAEALIDAEIMGQSGHGLSRVSSYAAQARAGKVDGQAEPVILEQKGNMLRIDACNGFAYPAIDLCVEALIPLAKSSAIACAAISRSHHAGQLSQHVVKLTEAGLIGIMFANTPAAIAPWGGSNPIFGTNPIAFGAPRTGAPPVIIDLALSRIARGKIMAAKKAGERIEEGWALDAGGQPTIDADAALAGTMIPIGEAKGAALALMVEILAATLTGAHHGFEASSLFDDKGPPPGLGQFMIAIDPARVSGGRYHLGLDRLIAEILAQEGTRLPGLGAQTRLKEVRASGRIMLSAGQYQELLALKQRSGSA